MITTAPDRHEGTGGVSSLQSKLVSKFTKISNLHNFPFPQPKQPTFPWLTMAAGAEYLASIYGTEKDKYVVRAFFFLSLSLSGHSFHRGFHTPSPPHTHQLHAHKHAHTLHTSIIIVGANRGVQFILSAVPKYHFARGHSSLLTALACLSIPVSILNQNLSHAHT